MIQSMSRTQEEVLLTDSSHLALSSSYSSVCAGDDQYPGMSNFVDGSGPIFSMYLEMATEEDKEMAETWKADAEGILIFVCLCVSLHLMSCASYQFISHQFISPRPVYSLLLSRR